MLTPEEKIKLVQNGKKYGDYVAVATAFNLKRNTVLKVANGSRKNEKVLDALVGLVQERAAQPQAAE